MGARLQVLPISPERPEWELFGAALEASPEALAIVDQGCIRYANASFTSLLGFADRRDLVGRSVASLRPRSQRCVRMSPADPARGENGNPVCRFRIRSKDGRTLEIEETCSSFEWWHRQLLVLSARDVSQAERRRTVRDSEKRYHAIVDAAAMGIIQYSMDGRVVESNPAVEQMLGYAKEQLRGRHFREFTHAEDLEEDLRLFQEIADGKRDAYQVEARYVGKNQASGWIRKTVSLVRDPEGQPLFAIGMTEDVTERKRAEQQLRDAQKMEAVGRLVGGVAHDFNNLLTGIMLYCDLLVSGLELGDTRRHHAEEIRMASEQGAALIQQLLAIARQQVVEPRLLCVNDKIGATRNLLERLIGENIEFHTELDSNLGCVRMDPAQVQQILFNLVLNARDAMSEGGRITVRTANCDFLSPGGLPARSMPGILLSVQDNGCGMSAETQAHLFEPFFTTKKAGRGNGLGLATVHDIVQNNSGTIEVESELGHGTLVRVVLPRAAEVSRECPEFRFSPGSCNETVLLLEDNATVRKAAERVLSECGYHVLEASTGTEALALAETCGGAIDLLLADVELPGLSGREVARQLRLKQHHLKCLYMSGFEPGPKNGGDQEPVVVFRKPFTGAVLLERVREILDAKDPAGEKYEGEKP